MRDLPWRAALPGHPAHRAIGPGKLLLPQAAEMTDDARFWDKTARRYAAGAISDLPGYERTFDRTRALLAGGGPAAIVAMSAKWALSRCGLGAIGGRGGFGGFKRLFEVGTKSSREGPAGGDFGGPCVIELDEVAFLVESEWRGTGEGADAGGKRQRSKNERREQDRLLHPRTTSTVP